MSLQVNLRHLETKDLELEGELTPEEMNLVDVDELISVSQSIKYRLNVQRIEGSLLVQGEILARLDCECSRCLKPFVVELQFDHWTTHLPLEGEEAVEVNNDCVDLTPPIREDILLGFPQHPLCESECGGLPAGQKAKIERKAVPEGGVDAPSTWAELNKLKF